MTIKVNGKQIYPQKRYAIVIVDGKCVRDYEDIKCPYDYTCSVCKKNKDEKYIYGDTKEQLIRKIKQVIFRNFKDYNLFMAKFLTPHLNSFAYKIAKEIVEFLGVK